jgi:tryptophan synthase alpha subunit
MMMNSIIDQFKKSSLFIPFIMCGHPTINGSIEAIMALYEAGADMIELGVPFSDPVADGPVNQRAAKIALENGVTLTVVLDIARKVRERGCDVPLILFSYLNPLLSFGIDKLAIEAHKAGINAVLIVDLPPEEGNAIFSIFNQHKISPILLTSPTTAKSFSNNTINRADYYHKLYPLFIYHISRLAVTGVQAALNNDLVLDVQQIRNFFPNTPVSVGFGISTPAQAKEISKIANGVIIGSILVQTLEEESLAAFSRLARQFAEAIHNE